MFKIGNDWDTYLNSEFQKEYFVKLQEFLKEERAHHAVYPNECDVFNAFKLTPLSNVRVVVLGQDPYHEFGQAHGLCFSVQRGTKLPPSLKNIFKEMESDLGIQKPTHGDLTTWAQNGVLMLNTVLTVRDGVANSHKGKGWEIFTDEVIRLINDNAQPCVFLLWGKNAQSKQYLIDNPNHLVLTCAHPSPLSAYNGFFDCKHFSRANNFLINVGRDPVSWCIE